MKKGMMVVSGIVLITLLYGVFYYYRPHVAMRSKTVSSRDEVKIMDLPKEIMAQDIAVFFDYAQEQLPKLAADIEVEKRKVPPDETKINDLEEQLKTFKIARAIAQKDLKTLEAATPEQLKFEDGQIWVGADRFNDTMKGRLASRILGGENALAFALFHSVMDKTEEDKNKTIAMLKILFTKKLDPNTRAGEVLWVKDKPTDTHSSDYVAIFSLVDIASIYSFPEAQTLIKDYANTFNRI